MPKACSGNRSSSRANSGPVEVNRAVMRAWPLSAWARGDLVTAAAEAEHALRVSRDAGHAYNWGWCAALLADVLIEQGDITRAGHVLDTAISAIEGLDRNFALRVLSPRQARAARLSGRTRDADAALARARPVQRPDQLAPERVVYLIEDALATLGDRDDVRAGHLIKRPHRAGRSIGTRNATPRTQPDQYALAQLGQRS